MRVLSLQALYSVRSERPLMQELDCNLLFRWFVGLSMEDAVCDVTLFAKNCGRLLEGKTAAEFLVAELRQAKEHGFLSDENFTVDGKLIEAWANRRSFQEKKGPPARGSGRRGKKLLRVAHQSRTHRESRLYRKSTAGEARQVIWGM